MNADDLMVGIDAFLESRRQIVPGLEFVRYHDDPFRQVTWAVSYLERWNKYGAGHLNDDYLKHAVPARLVRYVMACYERGTANRAAWEWLRRTEADDDLEVRGICPVYAHADADGTTWVITKNYLKTY